VLQRLPVQVLCPAPAGISLQDTIQASKQINNTIDIECYTDRLEAHPDKQFTSIQVLSCALTNFKTPWRAGTDSTEIVLKV
jgi:hypothetical protein